MTQLNRSIERWKGCDPAYMATEQSPTAITYAFIDAQHDILALAETNAQLLTACRMAIVALKGREHDGFLRDAISRATA